MNMIYRTLPCLSIYKHFLRSLYHVSRLFVSLPAFILHFFLTSDILVIPVVSGCPSLSYFIFCDDICILNLSPHNTHPASQKLNKALSLRSFLRSPNFEQFFYFFFYVISPLLFFFTCMVTSRTGHFHM